MCIALTGGKGGTGKTLLEVCLTEYLAGKNIFLLDVDVEIKKLMEPVWCNLQMM